MADDNKGATPGNAAAGAQGGGAAPSGAQEAAATAREAAGTAQAAGEAMRDSGQRMVQNGSTLGMKMIDQAETNAREAFAAMRAAANARDISDVMRIQSEFMREQGTRAMGQAREISELIVQFGRDAVAPMRGDRS